MSDHFSALLTEAGIIRFGYFGVEGKPYALSLDLLPSYPTLLKQLAEQGKDSVTSVDRLICVADALPWGIALSLTTGIPLVYSRGTGQAAVDDLAGAYDIGHPTLLVANSYTDLSAARQSVTHWLKVGLKITGILVLIDEGSVPIWENISATSVISMAALIDSLVVQGKLPEMQAALVRDWLEC